MFLSHQSIEQYIDEGKIIIKPEFDKKKSGLLVYGFILQKKFLFQQPNQTVEINKPQNLKYKEIDLTQEEFYLEPGQFFLGATFESIQTPSNILIILDGRSTIARLGITTHITASIIDGAFESPHAIVLEIKNAGNFMIKLKFKDPIAMIVFAELKETVTQKIQNQYGKSKLK